LLENCVRSLLQHAEGCELVVVDNASEDGSVDFADQLTHPPTVLRNDKNLGFAAANNLGWRFSKGELVLFLNPDTECRRGSVEALAGLFAESPSIWAAGGKLLHSSGEHQAGFNVRAFPSVGSIAAEMLMLDEIWPQNPWSRRYRMTDSDFQTKRDVDQPAAACLMVRRNVLEALDGFDEGFHPAWYEDVDLCRRIRKAGGRILFQPDARFVHHGGVSLSRLRPEEFLKYYHTNQLRYFAKHHGERAARRVRRFAVAGLYLRALLSWIGISPRIAGRAAPARAFREVARHLLKTRGGEP